VGNSSAGLVEAPLFGKPCINIGSRQDGRIGGPYTWNVNYDKGQIRQAISDAVQHYKLNDCESPYQSNVDGPRIIVKVLKGIHD
jgi:UDP-N-acetylglucosamine 2-epimerase